MTSGLQELRFAEITAYVAEPAQSSIEQCRRIFEEHRHRVYSLAFWMTDNELMAEAIQENTFRRFFARQLQPDEESINRALLAELRETMAVGTLTLHCEPTSEELGVLRNIKRVHLERAVIELPPTERIVFLLHDVDRSSHEQIARLLGLSLSESQAALHQARLRIRELLHSLAD